jgi:hypothetical protein
VAPFDPYSGPARAVNIALRTAHLGAMAVLAGGVAFGVPGASSGLAAALTVATGAALLLSEMSHGAGWLGEGRGLLAILHVAVAAGLFAAGQARAGAATALVVGAVGSHLPRSLRRWSIRRGAAGPGSAGHPEGR